MATQLTLVNKVLRRLREETVASTATNDYSILIGTWINDGIRDLSDRFAWKSLEHEITVTLAADTNEYDLSLTVAGGGDVPNAERATTSESILVWDDMTNKPVAFLFDDASDTQHNAQMRLITEEDRYRRYQSDRSDTNLEPTDFSLKLKSDGDGYLLTVSPTPSAARTIRIKFWTPQAEIAVDGTEDSTEVIVHNATVEAYAHLVASNERGEEMGEPGNLLERRYQALLGGIMETAFKNGERLNVYESHRD
jgi:hypothetical protein